MDTYPRLDFAGCRLAIQDLPYEAILHSIPDSLLESADIDGCGEIKNSSISSCQLKPGIDALAIFTFISLLERLFLSIGVHLTPV